jgi:hypothetical protein
LCVPLNRSIIDGHTGAVVAVPRLQLDIGPDPCTGSVTAAKLHVFGMPFCD